MKMKAKLESKRDLSLKTDQTHNDRMTSPLTLKPNKRMAQGTSWEHCHKVFLGSYQAPYLRKKLKKYKRHDHY